jgi:hypothetical protein
MSSTEIPQAYLPNILEAEHVMDEEPTTYANIQRWFWECMRDYVRMKAQTAKPLTRDELVGVGYAIREQEYAHRTPTEKLLNRLLFLLFSQDTPSAPLFQEHRQDVKDLLLEPGLAILLGPLSPEEREEVLHDLNILRFTD